MMADRYGGVGHMRGVDIMNSYPATSIIIVTVGKPRITDYAATQPYSDTGFYTLTGFRLLVVLALTSLRRLQLAASSAQLAPRACLLYGKRSCGFADSPTSESDARTTCTRGADPGVWPCAG